MTSKKWLFASLLLLLLFSQTLAHARVASLTFDEGPHLAAGYAYLRTGDLRLQPVHIHPPLANILAAAPLLLQMDLPDPRSVGGWEIASLSAITDTIIWQYPHPARLAIAGRFPITLMTLLLGAVVFRWASDLFGTWGGTLALTLYAFDPNIIAHGVLVTTDMAVTWWGTLSLFLTWRFLQARQGQRRSVGYFVGAGIALGFALASKVSALALIPILTFLWLIPSGKPVWRRSLACAANLALSALVLWAIYGFEARPTAGIPWPLPAATHLDIYRSLQEHYRLGHPAFLLGRNSSQGWWYYFPVAFVLKTPLPTLLLIITAALVGIRRTVLRKEPCFSLAGILSRTAYWSPLLLFPAWYIALTPLSSVNIGYRHLLPLLPFLFIFTGHLVTSLRFTPLRFTSLRFTPLRFTLYALLSWLILGTLQIAPHYLAFFNEITGGPDNGYRYLVDSNLDWGQNLWELRDWMRENGVERVFYAHFSPARPLVYGIPADFLPPDPRAVPFTPLAPSPGIYAIGATVLQGVYAPDVNTYAWFRTREPIARLGHALFIYRVESRPAPTWATVCASPLPVLDAETVRTHTGQPQLRVISVDCRRGWVWPAGGPGLFILPPEVEPPPGATLELRARHTDGRPAYQVFRMDERPSPEQAMEMEMDGPLTFLGISTTPSPSALEVDTWWRATEGPIPRPFSIMGHLLNSNGEMIGQADGLAVSPRELLPGDILIQCHRFEDAESADLTLRTGVYWLDTMERWPVDSAAGTDIILVPLNRYTSHGHSFSF